MHCGERHTLYHLNLILECIDHSIRAKNHAKSERCWVKLHTHSIEPLATWTVVPLTRITRFVPQHNVFIRGPHMVSFNPLSRKHYPPHLHENFNELRSLSTIVSQELLEISETYKWVLKSFSHQASILAFFRSEGGSIQWSISENTSASFPQKLACRKKNNAGMSPGNFIKM